MTTTQACSYICNIPLTSLKTAFEVGLHLSYSLSQRACHPPQHVPPAFVNLNLVTSTFVDAPLRSLQVGLQTLYDILQTSNNGAIPLVDRLGLYLEEVKAVTKILCLTTRLRPSYLYPVKDAFGMYILCDETALAKLEVF